MKASPVIEEGSLKTAKVLGGRIGKEGGGHFMHRKGEVVLSRGGNGNKSALKYP